ICRDADASHAGRRMSVGCADAGHLSDRQQIVHANDSRFAEGLRKIDCAHLVQENQRGGSSLMTNSTIGTLQSSPVIHRHPQNPILKPSDVPYGPALVFNAGVTKYQGQYVMVFRNDYGNAELGTVEPHSTTNLGLAFSDDGVNW